MRSRTEILEGCTEMFGSNPQPKDTTNGGFLLPSGDFLTVNDPYMGHAAIEQCLRRDELVMNRDPIQSFLAITGGVRWRISGGDLMLELATTQPLTNTQVNVIRRFAENKGPVEVYDTFFDIYSPEGKKCAGGHSDDVRYFFHELRRCSVG